MSNLICSHIDYRNYIEANDSRINWNWTKTNYRSSFLTLCHRSFLRRRKIEIGRAKSRQNVYRLASNGWSGNMVSKNSVTVTKLDTIGAGVPFVIILKMVTKAR